MWGVRYYKGAGWGLYEKGAVFVVLWCTGVFPFGEKVEASGPPLVEQTGVKVNLLVLQNQFFFFFF